MSKLSPASNNFKLAPRGTNAIKRSSNDSALLLGPGEYVIVEKAAGGANLSVLILDAEEAVTATTGKLKSVGHVKELKASAGKELIAIKLS